MARQIRLRRALVRVCAVRRYGAKSMKMLLREQDERGGVVTQTRHSEWFTRSAVVCVRERHGAAMLFVVVARQP